MRTITLHVPTLLAYFVAMPLGAVCGFEVLREAPIDAGDVALSLGASALILASLFGIARFGQK